MKTSTTRILGLWYCAALGAGALVSACGSTEPLLPDSRPDTPDAAGDTGFRIVRGPAEGATVGGLGTATPPTITFNNAARTATCRGGHVPEVDALPFAACPTPAATGDVAFPLPATAGKSAGAYRFDVQYEDADGATQTFARHVHVNGTLDGVTACNAGADWPSDAAWFAAATGTITLPSDRANQLPWVDPVTHQGQRPSSLPFTGISLQPPVYAIPFANVYTQGGTRMWNGTANVATGTTFTLPIVSLRHRLVTNDANTLLLIHRTYESRTAAANGVPGVCTIGIQLGTRPVIGDWEAFPCDALVINRAGEGVCMINEAGTAKVAVFSRTMVMKLTGGVSPDGTPRHNNGVFGPKIVDNVGLYPDGQDELVGGASPVIVKP